MQNDQVEPFWWALEPVVGDLLFTHSNIATLQLGKLRDCNPFRTGGYLLVAPRPPIGKLATQFRRL
jgi:hypothetical protein